MSDLLTLTLEHDNPCNTTIVDSDSGKVLYQVATEHTKKQSVTRVKNAAGETIASWEWRDVRSDVITLGTGSPVPTSAWLRKSLIPLKNTVTFHDDMGRKFIWKGNGPGLSFTLFSADDKQHSIAHFQKSRRVILDRTVVPPVQEITPACLVLDGRGEEIRDIVVISFLVLEKSRRANEHSTLNRTGVLAAGPHAIGINVSC